MPPTRPAAPEGFRTALGAFAATLGSAVGLGNIWKFPYLAGIHGGAAFVLVYLAAVALVGIPVLAAELAVGRRLRRNAVAAYAAAVPGYRAWGAIGLAGVAAAFLVMGFYTDVAGWVFAYVFKTLGAAARGTSLPPGTFAALAGGTWEPVTWQAGVLVLTGGILAAGVAKGIERVARVLLPVLFILLLVCDLRSLTLPGAGAGVAFLFKPDPARLTPHVLLGALGLAFFKLSLGMGAMTTYGAYLPDSARIVPTALRVALADTAVSLLAGLALFPAVFALQGTPDGGPGLLFETVPRIFARMPLGGWFTALFFVLAAVATIGAMVSLMEVPVAWLSARGRPGRGASAALVAGLMLLLGVPATLSRAAGLDAFRILGRTCFDLYDAASSQVLLPVGGLAIAILAGWALPRAGFLAELAKGERPGAWTGPALRGLLRWLAPGLILLAGFGLL